MTTNPNEIEAAVERFQAALKDPYDGGIWEGAKFNLEPFVTVRVADLRILINAAASARGVADGIERELARLPKGVSWSLGQMMGLPEHLRYRCSLSDHNTEDGRARHYIHFDAASPVEAIRIAIAKAETIWGYHPAAPSSPAATPEVERRVDVLGRIAAAYEIEANEDHAFDRALDAAYDAGRAALRTPPAPAGEEEKTVIEIPTDQEAIGLLKRAAEFLDAAAGMEQEIDGIDAMEIVTGLHGLLVEDTDRCFHEDVALWLAGKVSPTSPEDANPFTTGFIAGRDAAAGVADNNRTDDDSMWDRAAVEIGKRIRAIEPGEG